jgi:hypothetical protein
MVPSFCLELEQLQLTVEPLPQLKLMPLLELEFMLIAQLLIIMIHLSGQQLQRLVVLLLQLVKVQLQVPPRLVPEQL